MGSVAQGFLSDERAQQVCRLLVSNGHTLTHFWIHARFCSPTRPAGSTETDTEPVVDWAEDFDIFDDAFVKDPYPVWKDLRDQGCPFARIERSQVSFMPTTYGNKRNWLRSIIATDAPDRPSSADSCCHSLRQKPSRNTGSTPKNCAAS